ncbi:hypothetical protein AcV7_008953 [Taiwanofungus camphoratus]|nr:hypothetical protein AcV7_008953 [Antrodia cinnamomea]
MEWWSFFRTVRKAVFAVISVVSLLWAVLLSVYIAREWKHAMSIQRVIILVTIAVNGFTSLLLYLMLVVVFRIWPELARTIFLFAIHVGTAVPLTLFVSKFSCTAFNSFDSCHAVNVIFLICAWTIVTLFATYVVFLCLTTRVALPDSSATAKFTRRASSLSYSATDLDKSDVEQNAEPSSPVSVVSQCERLQAVPARLVVVTARVVSPPPRQSSRAATGLFNTPSLLATTGYLPDLPYRSSSLTAVPRLASPPPSYASQYSYRRTEDFPSEGTMYLYSASPQTRGPPRPFLLNPLIMDSQPRHGSPDSMRSISSVSSYYTDSQNGHTAGINPPPPATIANDAGHKRSFSSGSASLAELPPQLRPGTPAISAMRTGSLLSDSYSNSASMYCSRHAVASDVISIVRPPRSLTASPISIHSVHSVAPSLHYSEESEGAKWKPQSPVQANGSPPSRQHSAGAGLTRQPTVAIRLPNPHETAGAAELKRYASMLSEGGSLEAVPPLPDAFMGSAQ